MLLAQVRLVVVLARERADARHSVACGGRRGRRRGGEPFEGVARALLRAWTGLPVAVPGLLLVEGRVLVVVVALKVGLAGEGGIAVVH